MSDATFRMWCRTFSNSSVRKIPHFFILRGDKLEGKNIEKWSTEQRGYLLWDEVDGTKIRAIPSSRLIDEIKLDALEFLAVNGFDTHIWDTVATLCEAAAMKETRVFVADSLRSQESAEKTRKAACAWYLDLSTYYYSISTSISLSYSFLYCPFTNWNFTSILLA
jgi:hypothetical protein